MGLREKLRRLAVRKRNTDGRATIFVHPPNDTGFDDDDLVAGPRFWHGAGAVVMFGFRDPELGPHLPSVPENDPHRTSPPKWLTEEGRDEEP